MIGVVVIIIVLLIAFKPANVEKKMDDIYSKLDKYEITIKKIRNNQKDDKKSKDVNLVFRYHKDTNINSVFTEISALENVIDLEEA